jgi:carbonic anhydrase
MPRRHWSVPQSRRFFLGLSTAALAGFAITRAMPGSAAPLGVWGQSRPTPAEALQRLLDGNRRFVSGATPQADITAARRVETATGQRPFAAIVSCADSRVPPEIIFDQGLGDLFVCRNAGNFVDTGIAGSIEYAVGVLGVSLVFVLGHEACGAVKAAVDVVTGGAELSPNISVIVDHIRPAVERAEGEPGDLLTNAIRENVRLGMQRLNAEPPLMPSVAGGSIQIAGGEYNLAGGLVELIQ